MTRLLLLGSISLMLTAALGCGGASSTTAPLNTGDTLERQSAVMLAGDFASIEVSAETALAPAMLDGAALPGAPANKPRITDRERPLGITDACTEVVGSPRDGGSITFHDCATPRGLLNGMIIWTAGDGAWSSTTDLLYTRTEGGAQFHIVGDAGWTRTVNTDGSITIHRTGDSTGTGLNRRVENDSDMTWTRNTGTAAKSYPTGTQHTQVFVDDVLTHDVMLTFDGTSTVTAVVDGETYTYNFGDRRLPRPQHRPRPDRPRGR